MITPAPITTPIRVAVLVDLLRSPQSGGQVKCWERWAAAAALSDLPLDLTIYFSGDAPDEILSPRVRLRHLPPVFSTTRLTFLSYVPDHTDLASRHRRLEHELKQYDVIHTTDGFFAFAQTAERVSKHLGIPLTTSFHTDTPCYTYLYAKQTIEKLFGCWPAITNSLIHTFKLPTRFENMMTRKLKHHVKLCSYAMVTRIEDHTLAESLIGKQRVRHLRLGVDKNIFGIRHEDRTEILAAYNIPTDRTLLLFVGSVDLGKNIHTLLQAVHRVIADGISLHLIVAGIGPAVDEVRQSLGHHCSILGFVEPHELARLYNSVDLLCVPSEIEMRSMACVEAMQSGCPALVSQKSGIFELFNSTPAMAPVNSGVENWSKALHQFATDNERQISMRTAARAHATQYLGSWQDILAQDIFPSWQAAFEESEREPQ